MSPQRFSFLGPAGTFTEAGTLTVTSTMTGSDALTGAGVSLARAVVFSYARTAVNVRDYSRTQAITLDSPT